MRVDILPVRLIIKVCLLVEGGEADIVILVGRSLRKIGALNNENCGMFSTEVASPQWKNITCSQPALGQFIYIEIERKNNLLTICEIQVFYGNVIPSSYKPSLITLFVACRSGDILSIYSPVHVTASDQKEGFGSIWKPIDGVVGPAVEESWISLKSSQSWWRMQLPHRSAVSKVVIFIPSFHNSTQLDRLAKLTLMTGFTVYIGDYPVVNRRKNAMCGNPWIISTDTVITFNCTAILLGKYLYVAGPDRSEGILYVTEINVYGCEGDY